MAYRNDLAAETLEVGIPLTAWKQADLASMAVSGTEDGGDHFITLSTNTIALQGNAPNGDTQTDISWAQVYLPPNYVGGTNLTFKVAVKNATTADAMTVDLSLYEVNLVTGAVGSDLCATAAQATSATATDYSFTITGASLEPGSLLNLKLTTVAQDATTDGQASVWSTRLSMQVR